MNGFVVFLFPYVQKNTQSLLGHYDIRQKIGRAVGSLFENFSDASEHRYRLLLARSSDIAATRIKLGMALESPSSSTRDY
jgi:hypothetical protein